MLGARPSKPAIVRSCAIVGPCASCRRSRASSITARQSRDRVICHSGRTCPFTGRSGRPVGPGTPGPVIRLRCSTSCLLSRRLPAPELSSGVDAFQGRFDRRHGAPGLLDALKPPSSASPSSGGVMGKTVSSSARGTGDLGVPVESQRDVPTSGPIPDRDRPLNELIPRPGVASVGATKRRPLRVQPRRARSLGPRVKSDAASPGATDGPTCFRQRSALRRATGRRLRATVARISAGRLRVTRLRPVRLSPRGVRGLAGWRR